MAGKGAKNPVFSYYLPGNEKHIPPKMAFRVDDFPFLKVGYVSFLEGMPWHRRSIPLWCAWNLVCQHQRSGGF